MGLEGWKYDQFQSRNRDTFLFKHAPRERDQKNQMQSFNLVIEILFFLSPRSDAVYVKRYSPFQSRNRDTFLFKPKITIEKEKEKTSVSIS